MPGRRLQVHEREVIQRGLALRLDDGQIAALLGRHRSTVTREIARNSGVLAGLAPRSRSGHAGHPRLYRADRAQGHARRRARRPKPCKLTGRLGTVVAALLRLDWSPEQIAALLPVLFPGQDAMRVSHETIYQSLFVQSRGELRRELTAHLRTRRTARKPQGRPDARGKLVGMVSIRQRPAEADDRAVPGHWEGDLLMGAVGQGAVITLVERATRFVLLAPLPDRHGALDLRQMLTPLIAALPDQLRASLTWDQGKEMADHATITIDTGLAIYFADPHSPWQRGSNENTNGLLRQYWPKGSDLRHLTQADCDTVALKLNTRPRQTLGWKTPAQAIDEALRATAA